MKRTTHQIAILSATILFILWTSLNVYAIEITEIVVRGNTLIPDSTILSQIDSKVGLPYNPEIISEDIQGIYNLGFFSSIEVHTEDVAGGTHLIYVLKERPLISRIVFQGNKKLKKDQLEEVLTLSPSDLSDAFKLKFYPLKIQEDLKNLKQRYHEEGFYNAQITSVLLPDPSAPEEKVILQYLIEERKKARVKGINFEGNTAFSDAELRKQMSTKKKGLFSFLTGSGKYEETTFETDLERIKFFYTDHGYIDVQIPDYVLDFKENTSDLYISITIKEGDIYKISEVGVIGNTVYSTEEIQEVIKVTPNDPFSRSKIWKDRVAIADLYAMQGYLTPISENTEGKLVIDPKIRVNKEEKQIKLTYTIREGVPHFLNRLTITGNQNTRGKVIRREVKVYEGEMFNSKNMERSQQKVMNLGLFDDVQFKLTDGPKPYTVDLDIEVTERATGSFNFGGGYSSIDHFLISGGLSHANLFGLAHQIDFSATFSKTSQTFNLNYTVPRFLDSQYLVGLDAYKTHREYSAYESYNTGGGVRFGRKISDRIFGTVKYRYEHVNITDVEEDASAIIKEAEGLSKTSSVELQLKWSALNNVLLPTKGWLTKLSGEYAGGPFQGENNFYKIIFNNNVYLPVIKDVAIRLKGEFAYAEAFGESKNVPIFERFFAGGADTIRGYEERSISPKDENDEAIGGNKRVVLTSELIIPIKKELRLVAFFDMGDVYGSDEQIDLSTFKKGAGVGMRLFTPLGLIKIDWGHKLKREKGESASEIHFGIGGLF